VRSESDDGQTGCPWHPYHCRAHFEKLGAGESIEQVLAAHPRLSREAILATIEFGARALRADIVYPLPAA
jgi:hypothetical protein